ncbi:6-phosphogluconolactonase [Spirochaeta dissipatitropha]
MYAENPFELIQGSWDEIHEKAAIACTAVLQEAVQQNGQALLAIPGGRSILPLMQALADHPAVPWEHIQIFWVDERWVPLEHSDSNFLPVWDQILSPLVAAGRMHQDQVHPFRYTSDLPDGGVGLYQSEFRQYASRSSERFDLAVFGVGEDGHIASLFPHHEGIHNMGYGFIEVHDSPKPPADRVSCSRSLLANSRAAVLLFIGEGKREAWERFQNSSVSVESCPAKLALQAGHCIVISDLPANGQ